jgi:hypothetical protein
VMSTTRSEWRVFFSVFLPAGVGSSVTVTVPAVAVLALPLASSTAA